MYLSPLKDGIDKKSHSTRTSLELDIWLQLRITKEMYMAAIFVVHYRGSCHQLKLRYFGINTQNCHAKWY